MYQLPAGHLYHLYCRRIWSYFFVYIKPGVWEWKLWKRPSVLLQSGWGITRNKWQEPDSHQGKDTLKSTIIMYIILISDFYQLPKKDKTVECTLTLRWLITPGILLFLWAYVTIWHLDILSNYQIGCISSKLSGLRHWSCEPLTLSSNPLETFV